MNPSPIYKSFPTWDLEDFDDYVKSELTKFVGKHTESVYFVRISEKSMICVLTMKNGFDIRGESSCIDPRNYDPNIGAKYALHTAVDKASTVIAYLMQQRMFEGEGFEADVPAPRD